MRLLVASITYDREAYALEPFLTALEAQREPFDVLFVDNTPGDTYAKRLDEELGSRFPRHVVRRASGGERFERILNSRRVVRDFALEGEYTHVLMLDSDVLLPQDAIATFVAAGERLATGVYLNTFERDGKPALLPCLFVAKGGGVRHVSIAEVLKHERLPIAAAGLGCTFVGRAVLEQVPFRLNKRGKGEDVMFYRDAPAQAVALCSIKCTHLQFPLGDERNKPYELWRYRLDTEGES